jgi:3-oxoacyl-[acyl-carrier protein] reductase
MEDTKKIALVTGASRGIGESIALTLAKAGLLVIGTATTLKGANSITQNLEQFGGKGIELDVSSQASMEQGLDELQKQYGDVLILVNNAGITRDSLLLRMKEEDFDQVITTNLKSVFYLSKLVLRGMTKARFGRIVNITSVVASMGNPGQVNYASSKAAVEAFSKSLSKEVGSRNITVNCVAPGFIATDMTDKLSETIKEEYLKKIPLSRLGTPQEVANCVKFLVSNDASYVSGTTLHVNGGLF